MSNLKTEFQTEAVILLRQGGTTMAVHVPYLQLLLSPIIDDPGIPNQTIWDYKGPIVTGYETEATGVADKITVWVGPDPFAKPEIENPREEISA
jgi:hypothetical protein